MGDVGLVNAVLGMVMGILELAFPIATISAIYWHLDDVWVAFTGPNGNTLVTYIPVSCLLNSDYDSGSLCTYSYWVCGVSIFCTLGLMIGLFACMGKFVQLHAAWIASGLLFIWWLICAAIVTADVKKAMDQNSWQNSWRQTVVTCQWVTTILFFVQFLAALAMVFYEKRKAKKARDAHEKMEMAAAADKPHIYAEPCAQPMSH